MPVFGGLKKSECGCDGKYFEADVFVTFAFFMK